MAYEALAAKAIGTASHQLTDAFDVTRVEYDGQAIGLLIRTSEPINWQRTTLMLSMAAPQSLLPISSTGARLIAATFAAGSTPAPLDESVTILVDGAIELSGWRLEWRVLPDAVNPDPPWQLWYKFDIEPLRVAGQRVRIFAGKGDVTLPIVTGEDHRFGEAIAGFQPSFVGEGVDLRIIAPNNQAAHMRRFLPDRAYTVIPAKILRAADGTGFVLLRPSENAAGSQMDAAEYRLRWEYRRDNTALDSNSIILTRNGDSSPEVAQIDIPWSSHKVGETPVDFGSEVLADHPIAYFRFNEAAGTTIAEDSSGNANHGTFSSSGITLGAPGRGHGDAAALFSGGRMVVPNSPTLNPAHITLETLINWAGDNGFQQRIIEKSRFIGGEESQYGLSLLPDGRVMFEVQVDATNSSFVSTLTVKPSQLHHLVATYDGSLMRIYFNGVLEGEQVSALQGQLPSNFTNLCVGNQVDRDRPFNGLVDEIALYNKELSLKRVRAHADAAKLL